MPNAVYLNMAQFAKCAEMSESCAERASAVCPDRRIPVYCRDTADKCAIVAEALRTNAPSLEQRLGECIRSCDRCADACANSIHEFCRETARRCRDCADLARAYLAESRLIA